MRGPSDTNTVQTIPSTQTDDTEPDILKVEVTAALKHLKEGKAAGFNGISTEEIKPVVKLELMLYTKHM